MRAVLRSIGCSVEGLSERAAREVLSALGARGQQVASFAVFVKTLTGVDIEEKPGADPDALEKRIWRGAV